MTAITTWIPKRAFDHATREGWLSMRLPLNPMSSSSRKLGSSFQSGSGI